jgi:uncharacterized repeat protein (TIGR01451 family)
MSTIRWPRALAPLVVFTAPLSLAHAEPTAPAMDTGPRVQVEVRVEQEITRIDADGKPLVERRPSGLAHPGDILVYTLTARNVGDLPAFDPRVEDPIPAGTVLIPESLSAGPVAPTASLDGGATWGDFPIQIPAGLDADGQPLLRPAPGEAYTHLRWLLSGPLPAGAAKEVLFKVRIR